MADNSLYQEAMKKKLEEENDPSLAKKATSFFNKFKSTDDENKGESQADKYEKIREQNKANIGR